MPAPAPSQPSTSPLSKSWKEKSENSKTKTKLWGKTKKEHAGSSKSKDFANVGWKEGPQTSAKNSAKNRGKFRLSERSRSPNGRCWKPSPRRTKAPTRMRKSFRHKSRRSPISRQNSKRAANWRASWRLQKAPSANQTERGTDCVTNAKSWKRN